MNLKKGGFAALLSVSVALGGAAATTPASAHTLAAPKKPYGCDIHPNQKKCQTGTGGTRVTGGTAGNKGKTGGTRAGNGKKGNTRGTRSGNGNSRGTRGNSGKNGANGGAGTGGNGNGNGNGGNGANVNGAGANGSSPVPGQSLPVTGFGGTAQDLGASPRTAAAGTQPVVVGLASSPSSQRVTALPATGGGVPSQPASPLPAIFALALAALGLGLRKVAGRF